MRNYAGKLLVASPKLKDPNFAHSVVLVLQHNDEGAAGVVINRPTNGTISQLWQALSDQPCHDSRQVHFGGPCGGPVVAIHDQSELADFEIDSGLYVAADRNRLQDLVDEAPADMRLFIGHAGWEPGQLEQELAQGSWLTADASPEIVFMDGADEVWQRSLKHVGETVLLSAPGVKGFPRHVVLN